MANRRALLVVGLGGLGLAGLVGAALLGGRGGGLGDAHAVEQSTKFYAKKYGLSPEDARRLVTSPRRARIDREVEEWRAQYGYPDNNSPLVRGFVRDRVRALAGLGASRELQVIASESRTPEEYARRAEAWASGEARPPSTAAIIAAYRRRHPSARPAQLRQLLAKAQGERISYTRKRWRGYMAPDEHEDLID